MNCNFVILERNHLPAKMSVHGTITHVIFDLDGLLVDSEPIYSRATNEICEKYGSKFNTDLELQTTGSTGLKV